MKSTGIVRRIDELGRVVIPKELRRTMRIREGEEMEVYATVDNTLVLRKYSAIKEMQSFAEELANAIYTTTGHYVAVVDKDTVIATSSGANALKGNKISFKIEQKLNERKNILLTEEQVFSISGEEIANVKGMAIAPIINNGDVNGGVILFSKRSPLNDSARTVAETAASFLALQI